ncbi:hypothetical protein HN51_002947 [Arachis hypogaea]|uniref:Protein FATTY ACID EXPORT 2 n=1 Tax=Arachis hypogaea TaxID=3818 RepID=A0A445EKK1_ARAHY|nr:protein FATTY ACID EXPORT 2, chloroplastic [Arachis hypogaea]QHO51223.1 Protein FATTY ACID EXPORT 2 [Arachis hypogaea]RYR75987.1 hypothetical protein Ahy_A01g000583 [Arachis hypogaea]
MMAEAVFGVSTSPSFSLRPTTATTSSRTFHTLPTTTTVSLFHTPAFSYLRQSLTHSNTSSHVYAAVVSSDSKASSVDLGQPELDNTGGGGSAGNGFGDRGGGGGGGGRGNDDNKDKEGSDAEHKRRMALLMSQKFTLGYAALVGVGGLMGYLKSGSQKSLLAGGVSAALLYYVYTELPLRPVFASSVGLGISAALLAVMGSRFKKSGKIFPAGVVSLVSLIMTGGYLHGIMRSSH